MWSKDGPVTCQVVEVIHNYCHEQIDNLHTTLITVSNTEQRTLHVLARTNIQQGTTARTTLITLTLLCLRNLFLEGKLITLLPSFHLYVRLKQAEA